MLRMMRSEACLALVAAGTVWARSTHAETTGGAIPDSPAESARVGPSAPCWARREGWYVRLGGGPSMAAGEYSSRSSSTNPGSFSGEVSGTQVGGQLEVGLGYGLVPGLGLALVGSLGLEDAEYVAGSTTIDSVGSARLMLAADYYPVPDARWNLIALAGFAHVGFGASVLEDGTSGGAGLDQQGFVGAAGAGYTVSGPASLEGRLIYLRTRDEGRTRTNELDVFGVQLLAVVKDF